MNGSDGLHHSSAPVAPRRRLASIRCWRETIRPVLEHQAYYAQMLSTLPYTALRRITRGRCRGYSMVRLLVQGKHGLEVGGPSTIFCPNRLIPVYDSCRAIDNCDFSKKNIWRGATDGRYLQRCLGSEFVAEACDLRTIANETYDFVLGSHVLEHVANPLRALQEWMRVLKPDGGLVIVVPDKRVTFDRLRPYTTFEHLVADFQANTPEDDLTHMSEIVELHDLTLDPGGGSMGQFRERCSRNSKLRAMHHHVFRPEVLVAMFSHLGMRVLNLAIERRFHIICLAQKSDPTQWQRVRLDNLKFLREDADWRRNDPYAGLTLMRRK